MVLACTLVHLSTAYTLQQLPVAVLRLKNQAGVRTGLRQMAQMLLVRAAQTTANTHGSTDKSCVLELDPRPSMPEHVCSCADVWALEKRVDRLESLVEQMMTALTSSDDMLLLEREGSKCFIANEGLTSNRPAKLLRTQLLQIMKSAKM